MSTRFQAIANILQYPTLYKQRGSGSVVLGNDGIFSFILSVHISDVKTMNLALTHDVIFVTFSYGLFFLVPLNLHVWPADLTLKCGIVW